MGPGRLRWERKEAIIWVALVIVTLLLGIGATASHAKVRWAGVRNVEEVDHS